MAKPKGKRNNLTARQEILIRDFLDACAEENIAFASEVIGGIITKLGYKIIGSGKMVRHDTEVKFIYGDPDPFRNYEDEYQRDGEALRAELRDAEGNADNTGTDEASTSEPTTSDAVGDVL